MSYFKDKYLNTIEYKCRYSKTKALIRKWAAAQEARPLLLRSIVSRDGRAAKRDVLDWDYLECQS